MINRSLSVLLLFFLLAGFVRADSSTIQFVDVGRIVDAYALADGGSIIIAIKQGASNDYYLTSTYWPANGLFSETDKVGLAGRQSPPTKIVTEICGGRLHVFYGWEDGRVYHYVWDLPIEEVKKSHLPFVCRGQ